mmetsp:Transcript_62366/g.171341  ORF Transcript_62366/g.171341 Transcript_62366/m.171341 type:complete len:226 (+) Transcript_62366:126-803(+)
MRTVRSATQGCAGGIYSRSKLHEKHIESAATIVNKRRPCALQGSLQRSRTRLVDGTQLRQQFFCPLLRQLDCHLCIVNELLKGKCHRIRQHSRDATANSSIKKATCPGRVPARDDAKARIVHFAHVLLRLVSGENDIIDVLQHLGKTSAKLVLFAHAAAICVAKCCIEAPTKRSKKSPLSRWPLVRQCTHAHLAGHDNVDAVPKIRCLAVALCDNEDGSRNVCMP